MKKFIKKLLKLMLILISVFVVIVGIISCWYFGNDYDYTDKIECLNAYLTSYEQGVNYIVFEYENDDNVVLTFYTNRGGYYRALLAKKIINGTTYYDFMNASTSPPVTYNTTWTRMTKEIFMIYVKYENDIDDIDCCGYTPVGTKITFIDSTGKAGTAWLYIVDTSKQTSAENKKFYNYEDILNAPFRWKYL